MNKKALKVSRDKVKDRHYVAIAPVGKAGQHLDRRTRRLRSRNNQAESWKKEVE